jgi:hypothetical protein
MTVCLVSLSCALEAGAIVLLVKVSRQIPLLSCCKDLETQLDLEKLRNRQILFVLTVSVCYYWTKGQMYELLTIKCGTVLNF